MGVMRRNPSDGMSRCAYLGASCSECIGTGSSELCSVVFVHILYARLAN